MRRLRSERGQTATEYVGVILITALIIGVIASSDIDAQLNRGVQSHICAVLNDDASSCSKPEPAAKPQPSAPSRSDDPPRLGQTREAVAGQEQGNPSFTVTPAIGDGERAAPRNASTAPAPAPGEVCGDSPGGEPLPDPQACAGELERLLERLPEGDREAAKDAIDGELGKQGCHGFGELGDARRHCSAEQRLHIAEHVIDALAATPPGERASLAERLKRGVADLPQLRPPKRKQQSCDDVKGFTRVLGEITGAHDLCKAFEDAGDGKLLDAAGKAILAIPIFKPVKAGKGVKKGVDAVREALRAKRAKQLAKNRRKARRAERLGGADRKKTTIQIPGKRTPKGKPQTRVPDRLDDKAKVIEEIKAGKGALSRRDIEQIKDFVRYGRANGYKVVVTTRKKLGPELERLERAGEIEVRRPRRVVPRRRQR